jgi:hypothetical protein
LLPPPADPYRPAGAQALFRAAQADASADSDVKLLCAQIFGMIGAVDPARFPSAAGG